MNDILILKFVIYSRHLKTKLAFQVYSKKVSDFFNFCKTAYSSQRDENDYWLNFRRKIELFCPYILHFLS